MSIPDYQSRMLPVLKRASDNDEHKFSGAVEAVTINRGLSPILWITLAVLLLPMAVMANSQEVEKKLVAAAKAGSLTEIQQLVTKDVDLNKSNALAAAVNGGHLDVVKYLVENGADPNPLLGQGGFETPPLYASALEGRPEVLEYFVAQGANLNYELPDNTSVFSTPLISAVYYGDLDRARLLIKYGADVNFVSKRGNTALNQVIKHVGGREADDLPAKFVELLLANGANPDILDRNGFTVRQKAKLGQHPELSALIEAAMPSPPGTVQASAADIITINLLLFEKATCDQEVPGFKERSALAYETWKNNNYPIVAQIENSDDFKEQIAEAKANTDLASQNTTPAREKIDADYLKNICDDGFFGQLAGGQKAASNSRLATPELTFAYFMESLRVNDEDAVLACLTSSAKMIYQGLIRDGAAESLRDLGNSIPSFELTGFRSGNVVEGVSITVDGSVHNIYFENINGEWKISEM